jgi:hypothetical protein
LNGDTHSYTINSTTIDHNTAGDGGLGGNGSGVTGVDGNDGYQGGGGGLEIINDMQGSIQTSTINANSAYTGGGLEFASGGRVSMINSTVSGNTAVSNGGGFRIYGTDSNALLVFVTVTANSTGGDGGGFDNDSGITLFNTIVAENSAIGKGDPDCSGTAISNGNNLIGIANSPNCGFTPGFGDLTGTTISPLDPQLAILADNGGPTMTHSLLKFSPAVDHISGPNFGCGTNQKYDQRGVIRFSPCDIGAYERDKAAHIYLPALLR